MKSKEKGDHKANQFRDFFLPKLVKQCLIKRIVHELKKFTKVIYYKNHEYLLFKR